jgi:hypothetical protein
MIRQVKLLNDYPRKILLSIVFFYCLSVAGYSQDKIITTINDTIDCKITKITRNTIYFDMFTRGVKTAGSFPLSNVLNYTISATGTTEKPKSFSMNSFERVRLGISGGAGYLLASSEKAEEYLASQGLDLNKAKSYYRNMKTGWNANADLTFMITPDVGAGFKYKFFYTSGSVEGFFNGPDGVHLLYTTYGERIFVNYYAPMVYYQQFLNAAETNRVTTAYSFGLTTYRNETEYLNGYSLLTGRNLGTDASIGLEYFFMDRLSVGAELSAFYSMLRKVEITDGTNTNTVDLDKENYENLSRLELSIGIRFYFWKK